MKKFYIPVSIVFALIFQFACSDTPVSENAANFGRDKVFPSPLTENPSLEIYLTEYVSAQNRKDEEKIYSLTYPKAAEIEGGRESFLSKLNQTLDGAENYAFLAGKPVQTLKKDNLMLVIIPVSTKQKVKEGWRLSRAVLAGVTEDEGRHWTFVDVSDAQKRSLIFPALAGQMVIPEIKSPWIER